MTLFKKFLCILLILIFPSVTSCDNSIKDSDFNKINLSGAEINVKDSIRRYIEGIGDVFYIYVRNSQLIFKFDEYVEVSNQASYIVSTDVTGRSTIVTRTVELYEGGTSSNLYYIYVSNDVERKYETYPILIHRNYMFTINFDSDGGSYCESQKVEEGYCLEEKKIPEPSKKGYTFACWNYDFSKPITSNLTVKAIWSANLNKLTITSESSSKGYINIISGSGYSGETIKVAAYAINNCYFKGWYNGSNLLSSDDKYTFTMPNSDYSLVARFSTWDEFHAVKPILNREDNTIKYGLFPQTNINDVTLLKELNSLNDSSKKINGWYFYKNEYYVKITSFLSIHVESSNPKFDNGDKIKNNEIYWFKCEPILWDIISSQSGKYTILARNVIDASSYVVGDLKRGYKMSNYMVSRVRAYLNGYDASPYCNSYHDYNDFKGCGFFDTAFNLYNGCILTTNVINRGCDNTNDKIYITTYQDICDLEESKRVSICTDYARANGAWFNVGSNCGIYYTRTNAGDNSVYYVGTQGKMGDVIISLTERNAIRPALCIKI